MAAQGTRWPVGHVEALSPDASSTAAGRRLAAGPGWSHEGCTDAAVWGQCQGSGRSPYRTVVDLTGPAFSCTCPSRKFPCKHALGLLLRWSAGHVPTQADPADFAGAWLASRAARAEQSAGRATDRAVEQSRPSDRQSIAEAAARRAQARVAKVTAGLGELDRWLADQVRSGLAGLPAKGYGAFEPMAARMVDAQAPGIASWLRALPAVVAGGPGWPERLLEELALLRLLVRSHDRLSDFDSTAIALAATIRQHIGYPVAKESVLTRPAVVDTWSVWAWRDSAAGNLQQRTVWVQGQGSSRMAVVLSFAAAGQSLDASLVPGTALTGALHFYPGSRPSRALVGEHEAPGRPAYPSAGTAAQACDAVAATLAADPWARDTAVWVAGLPVRGGRAQWLLADEVGETLPLRLAEVDLWRLVATCGGLRHPVLLDWSPLGWSPMAVATPEGLVGLAVSAT